MSNPAQRRPHVCPTCGKAYTKAAHLRDHQESVHQGICYMCSKCQKPFVKESYRNHHQQQCTGTHYSCNDCHQDFTSLQQLRNHRASAHQPQINNRQQPHPPEARPSTSQDDAAVAGPSHAAKRLKSDELRQDPPQPQPHMLPPGQNELEVNVREVFIEHWSAIRTHHRTNQ